MYGERPLDIIISGFWHPVEYTGYSLYGGSKDGSQRVKAIRKLLDSGSNLDYGDAPLPLLHSAIRHHDIAIMKLLLEQGIPVDILDSNGMTAIDYAKSNNKHPDWIRLLEAYLPDEKKGADVGSKGNPKVSDTFH